MALIDTDKLKKKVTESLKDNAAKLIESQAEKLLGDNSSLIFGKLPKRQVARRIGTPGTLTAWTLGNGDSTGLTSIGSNFSRNDAPKLKFLFTVSFEMAGLSDTDQGSDEMSEIVLGCKNVTRPNINVNYADVNSYNYRYKVATRIDYGTVTLSMYDDNKNTAHKLLHHYLEAISPLSRQKRDTPRVGGDVDRIWSGIGALPTNAADGVIRSMRVTHHFNKTNGYGESSFSRVHYDYINPKIQSFVWDELDMSVSDVSMLTATFVFDSVNITTEEGTPEYDYAEGGDDYTPVVTVGDGESVS